MNFEEYVKEAISNGELERQHEVKLTKNVTFRLLTEFNFQLFPRGLLQPHNYGSLPENLPKNRYKNLVACK